MPTRCGRSSASTASIATTRTRPPTTWRWTPMSGSARAGPATARAKPMEMSPSMRGIMVFSVTGGLIPRNEAPRIESSFRCARICSVDYPKASSSGRNVSHTRVDWDQESSVGRSGNRVGCHLVRDQLNQLPRFLGPHHCRLQPPGRRPVSTARNPGRAPPPETRSRRPHSKPIRRPHVGEVSGFLRMPLRGRLRHSDPLRGSGIGSESTGRQAVPPMTGDHPLKPNPAL